MNQRFRGLFAIALVGGILIAGCGGGGGNSSTSSSTKTAAATHSASSSTTSSSTSAASPQVAAVVTRCKASIQAVPTLSSSEKNQLLLVCQRAANGNVAGATAAVRQVCVQIANHLPAAARTEAVSLCKASVASGATSSATGTATTPSIPTNGAAATAAVLKAACKSYSQFAKALPGNIASSLTSVCQKVSQGDISGAKSELKQVCESVVHLLPSSEQSAVSSNCSKL